jgi:predicted peroxiredoxin
MKRKMKNHPCFATGAALVLCLTLAGPAFARQTTAVAVKYEVPAQYKQTVQTFEARVKEYSRMREEIEGKMPKLPKESTPEQIQAHETAFLAAVRAARAGAKPGAIFTPDAARYIRLTIKGKFKGKELQELRQTVREAETQGVPLRVNYPYPETKELVEMPPTLLLILPQLPKQVRYRFVGRNMMLVDRENGLILDYMLDALP